MKLFKALATAAIAAVCLWAVWQYAWVPQRTSRQLRGIIVRTTRIYAAPDPIAFIGVIRRNIDELRDAQRTYPVEVDLYMLEAANLRLLNRYSEAAETYRRALHFDRRPELYLNLGAMQEAVGDNAGALESFLYCVRFNPVMLEGIENEQTREKVRALYHQQPAP